MYHLHINMTESMSMPIKMRRHLMEKFVAQREAEDEAMQASQRKKR
jgi:hypothetical protein